MIIYVCATIISIIFAYISIYLKKDIRNTYANILRKISILLSFLPLFIVSAIRYDVGTDYFYRYVPGFIYIQYGGIETYEKGFILLNKFILLFTSNYQWLFVVTSFIFCFFTYKAIYDQSKGICLSIALLLVTSSYFISLNTLRQCMSVAIFLYATKYIKNRNIYKYMFWIFIAIMFHSSSIIYIPVYFIINNKIKYHFKEFIAIVIFMPILAKIFILFVNETKYTAYFSSEFNTGKFDLWMFIINFSVLIFCYIFYNKGKNDSEYIIFVNIQFITVILLLFSSIIPLISRIIICFTFSQVIFLPKIINYIKSSLIRNSTKILIVILYTIYMANTIILRGYHEVLPYKTIL
ncbi:EpsG family protein [Clostridium perfringens]|nr:EpsG family protein [Clostridium perfringens]